MAAGPAAEGRELDVVPVPGRATQHESRAAQHPGAVDPRVGDVVDVVGRHVLEITRDGVEPEAIGPIHVTETDSAVCDEAPPVLGRREKFVLHSHMRSASGASTAPTTAGDGGEGRARRRARMCANTGMSAGPLARGKVLERGAAVRLPLLTGPVRLLCVGERLLFELAWEAVLAQPAGA